MKTTVIRMMILGLLAGVAACDIVDPLLIAMKLPLEVGATIASGGSSWNERDTLNILDEINKVDASYADKVKATRLSTIRVYMQSPVPTGTASGAVYFQLQGDVERQILTFTNLDMARLAEPGVSMLDTTAVQYNATNLGILVATFTSSTGLPASTVIIVRTQGTTSPPVAAGTKIYARFEYEADAEIAL
jgi:hypothetical protein